MRCALVGSCVPVKRRRRRQTLLATAFDGSSRFQIHGFRALGVRLSLEGYALAFRKAAHARGLDGGYVHKDVLAATFGGHKTEAFTRIEEFHCSNSHVHSRCLTPSECLNGAEEHNQIQGLLPRARRRMRMVSTTTRSS